MKKQRNHAARTAAIITFILCCSTLLSFWLTVAFPTLGRPEPYTAFLYIPPQTYFLVLFTPLTIICAFVTAIQGMVHSWHAQRIGWFIIFGGLFALLLLGPTYLMYAVIKELANTSDHSGIPTPDQQGWGTNGWIILVGVSFGVILLVALSAALYSMNARHSSLTGESERS